MGATGQHQFVPDAAERRVHLHKLVNIAILKDWKVREARFSKKPDYPKCAVHVMPLPIWSVEKAQDYINKRVEKHRAEAANPPVCNKQERWQRDASFAVMRSDRKRAVKLCMSRQQAEAVMLHGMKICSTGGCQEILHRRTRSRAGALPRLLRGAAAMRLRFRGREEMEGKTCRQCRQNRVRASMALALCVTSHSITPGRILCACSVSGIIIPRVTPTSLIGHHSTAIRHVCRMPWKYLSGSTQK